jgi:hypothetical protein
VPPRTVEHIEQLERVEQSRTNGDSARTERTRTSLSQFDPRTALEQPCCSDCANKSNRSCHPGRSASHPAATAAVTSHRRRRITLIVVFDLAPPSRSHPLASPLSPHPSPSSPLSLLNHHPALQLRERRVILIALRACTDGPSEGCGEMYSHTEQRIATMPLSVQRLYKSTHCS